jgi:hypothetical protein
VFKKTTLINMAVTCFIGIALVGCIQEIPSEKTVPPEETVQPEEPAQTNPRIIASLQLTEQGRRLLESDEPDSAIRVLEQAISLHPTNGQNYYYLAEAWLMKDVTSEAKKFNRLADMHLKSDKTWMKRVADQANRIAEFEK